MNGNHAIKKQAFSPGKAAKKWILHGLVALFACWSAWGFSPSWVKAAEPDLSLLKAAFAVSEFPSQTASSPLAIPAAAFRVDGSGRQWFFPFNSGYIHPSGGTYCGIAPVSLPDGAQVTSFLSYVLDNDVANDAFVYLYAKPLGTTASTTTMAQVGTTGQNAALQALVDGTITQPFINNSAYVYHVGVCLWGTNSNQQFYAVKINFRTFTYLPMIFR
jgi:hypothetical protein